MKKTARMVLGLAALAFAVSTQAAPFTAGNLVIYRIGDGITPLAFTGNPVFLDEYTPSGTLVQSIAMPTNQVGDNYPVIGAGGATGEGELTRSTGGRYLFLTGYATNAIATSLQTSSSATIPRVVVRVDDGGNIDTTTVLTDFADVGSPRGATSPDGTNIWIAGSTGGIRYTTLGSANSTQLTNQVTNIRRVSIFNDTDGNNQLFFSDASGTTFRLGTAGPGLPTTSGQVYTNLPGFRTFGGPYDFVFLNLQGSGPGPDTLYITDDNSSTPAPVAGIEKWSLVGGSWVSNGVIPLAACRGLTATTASGGNALLYATGSYSGPANAGAVATNIFGFTDTSGYNAAPVWSTNFIADIQFTNASFRGIAFAPDGSQTNSWTTVGSGSWQTAGNWLLGIPPASDQTVLITNAVTKTVTIDATTSGSFPSTMTISNLTVSAPSGSTNTLSLNNGGSITPLRILNNFTIDANGAVLVSNSVLRVDGLSGGAFTIDGGVVVRDNGSVIATNGPTYVGYNGTGQITVSNAAVLAGSVYLGHNPGSYGTLTLAGGGSATTLSLLSPATLGGTGEVVMAGPQPDSNHIQTYDGGTITVGASVTIHGAGHIVGDCANPLVNQGTIRADTSNQTLYVSCFVNQGQLIATNGATLSLNSFVNNGTVVNGSVLSLNGAYTTAAMGTISNATNSMLILNGVLSGSGTITGDVVNQGNVQATGGTTLNFTGSMANHGSITATGGTVLRFFGPVLNTGLIDGSGGDVQFFSSVNNVGSGVILTPTNSWTGGSDKWETSTNWSHGTVPSSTDDANLITNAGNNTVTIDATTAGSFPGTMTIRNLAIAGAGASTNTLALANAGFVTPLHVLYDLNLSNHSAVVINNSALQVDGVLSMGLFGSDNQLIITNGGQLATATADVGTGIPSLDSVVVTGSNSLWTSYGTIQVGYGGTGDSLTIADGGSLIASNASHTAQVIVNGATIFLGTGTFKPDNLVITNGGAIQYTQTYHVENTSVTVAGGSDVQAASNLVLSASATSTSSVTVAADGSVTATNGFVAVGNDGTVTSGGGVATMTVDGSLTTAGVLLGSSAGGQGEMILRGNGQINGVGNNCVWICNDFTQIGGNLGWTNIGSTFYCGYAHPGAYALSNGTSSCQDVYVGYDNAGSMTIAGGTMNILSRLIVGDLGSPMSTGAVWITGGQLTVANYSILGSSGVGQMSISNGTVTAADVFVGNSGNPGTLTLAGGTLTVNGIVVSDPNSQFIFSGGSLIAKAITNANGQACTVGNAVGLATLSLTGGTSSLGNGLNVSPNATLAGLGVINGNVVNNGFIVSVGGALTFNGLVTNYGAIITNGISFPGGLVNHGAILDAAGDADGDGMNNLAEVLAGTNPTNNASFFHVTAVTRVGNDVQVSWSAVGGKSYVVQAAQGSGGNYSSNFADISQVISVPGSGESTANFTEPGAAISNPTRYYRVRLGP